MHRLPTVQMYGGPLPTYCLRAAISAFLVGTHVPGHTLRGSLQQALPARASKRSLIASGACSCWTCMKKSHSW